MSSMIFKNTPQAYQPLPQGAMDVHSTTTKEPSPNHDHSHSQCGSESQCRSHKSCHDARRRRLLRFALFGAAALFLLAFIGLMYTHGCNGMVEMLGSGVGLAKRQSNGGTVNDDGDGVFVKNKLYLIVIFVGLFVCLVLGIMLSAWCCRGAFENPCCCPCYLCACCGGLACLECISCGLCAEGFDQIGYD